MTVHLEPDALNPRELPCCKMDVFSVSSVEDEFTPFLSQVTCDMKMTDAGRWFGVAWVNYEVPRADVVLHYGAWGLTLNKAKQRCLDKMIRDRNLEIDG